MLIFSIKFSFQPVGGKVGNVGNANPVCGNRTSNGGRVGNVGNIGENVAPGGSVIYGNGVGLL